ncbi:MAG TPA: hypothetical protein ENK81_03170 [Euryarchaeota archaeon]|nr:hypothetical protein [Euryarchaeota archaeon]
MISMPWRLRLISNDYVKKSYFIILLIAALVLMSLFTWFFVILERRVNELEVQVYDLKSTLRKVEDIINNRTPLGKEKLADLIVVDSRIRNISISIYSGNFSRDIVLYTKWVHAVINYTDDGFYPLIFGNVTFIRDFWQKSTETLNLRRGDCEDLAILLAALIKASYTNASVYVVAMEISGNALGHAALLVVYENHAYIADPTVDRIFSLGNELSEIKSSVLKWFSEMGGISVRLSFIVGKLWDGKSVYKSFNSNLEFIEWLDELLKTHV